MQRHVASAFSAAKTSQISNLNGANGMSDMAGNAARVAVECGGRCRDTTSEIIHPTSCSKTKTTSSEPAQWTGRTAEEHKFLCTRESGSVFKTPAAACSVKHWL